MQRPGPLFPAPRPRAQGQHLRGCALGPRAALDLPLTSSRPLRSAPQVPAGLRKAFSFLPATVRLPQAIKAERCRFLETAQCASVCVNSCKVPSQEWLGRDFGMPLHIQPNYEDFSCTWRFNTPPPPLEEDQAILVPCFALCPSEFKARREQPRGLAGRPLARSGPAPPLRASLLEGRGALTARAGRPRCCRARRTRRARSCRRSHVRPSPHLRPQPPSRRAPRPLRRSLNPSQRVPTLPTRSAVEALESIAMRASPEALRDAGVRAGAVSSGGKCWSIDPERAKAVEVMKT